MKKIKSLLSFVLISVMLFVSVISIYADNDSNIKSVANIGLQVNNTIITIDGQEVAMEDGITPIILEGRTLVPIRVVVEAMGGNVTWDEVSQIITLNYDKDEIKLTIDSVQAYLNGTEQILDVSPSIINGTTMLPIRFIAESFGFQVAWQETTGVITIIRDTKKDITAKNSEKILIAYFSMPESKDAKNMTQEEENSTVVINGEVLGNTQYMANIIQESTDADIYYIEPEMSYPLNHATLVEQAKEEQNQNFRPTIKTQIENIEDYDTIFLGYPNWLGDMPMILYSFLEEYNLSGKTIIPFNSHGGSGFSNTISSISKLQPGAKIEEGLTISRNDVAESKDDIIAWINMLNLIKK